MMNKRNLGTAVFFSAILFVGVQACNPSAKSNKTDEHAMAMDHLAMDAPADNGVEKAICILQPTEGNSVSGTVTFTQSDSGMVVTADVKGLKPGKHGFHIHQFGDLSAADGTSAGGHFNPEKMDHGAPHAGMSHVGDMGNLEAGADGTATYNVTYPKMTFSGSESILGRGIIVHADEDDLVSQPTGAAGKRVAIGVIGVAKQ